MALCCFGVDFNGERSERIAGRFLRYRKPPMSVPKQHHLVLLIHEFIHLRADTLNSFCHKSPIYDKGKVA
jgi:hypothetical protein